MYTMGQFEPTSSYSDWGPDLDFELDLPGYGDDTAEDLDDGRIVDESDSASANEEGVSTGDGGTTAPPTPKKAGMPPLGLIALGGLALYIITQK